MQPSDVEYVIYHGGCSDGFTCALIANEYFKKSTKNVKYHAASFYNPPPFDEIKDANVLFCDFAYNKEDMQRIIELSKNMLIIDHHIGAQEELKDIPSHLKIYDMNECGASLTYQFFYPQNKTRPMMIDYVKDNDLWIKKQPKTLEFTAYMYSLDFKFEQYSKLLDDDFVVKEAFVQGEAMVKQNNCYMKKLIKHACIKFINLNNQYYFVAYLNSAILKSELGNLCLEKFPDINFSVIYSYEDDNNATTFSLRSTNDHNDVNKIAKLFGGKGHRNASGCCIPTMSSHLPSTIVDHTSAVFFSIQNNLKLVEFAKNEYVVILNSSIHKKCLGKYLLQDRNNLQETNLRLKNDVFINTSVVWSYDSNSNKNSYLVMFKNYPKNNLIKQKLLYYTAVYFDVKDLDSLCITYSTIGQKFVLL